jgi:hypothetical protein
MKSFTIDENTGAIKLHEGLASLSCSQAMRTLAYNKRAGDNEGRERKRYHEEVAYIYHVYYWGSSFVNEQLAERKRLVMKELSLKSDISPSPEMQELIDHVERVQKSDLMWVSLEKSKKTLARLEDLIEASTDTNELINFLTKKPTITKVIKEQEEAFYSAYAGVESRGGMEISEWER